jgi:hypothetical protein
MVVSSDQLFRRTAFRGEKLGQEGSFTRGHFPAAQAHRGRGDGSGIGEALSHLWDHKSMTPPKIWAALGVTKQGTMKLMQPLLDAGLMRRVGTRKSGRYILA